MFLTSNSLATHYGVHEKIARFYVDREPPKDNLYWKDKLLYLRPKPGYLFLPLITDLYYRSGISMDILLSEDFVQMLEQIGHYSAEEEIGIITQEEALQKCIQLVENKHLKGDFLKSVVDYFTGKQNFITELTTPFPALHRGDFFLFAICLLESDPAKQKELVKIWFALISTLLLLDDAEDFENDKDTNEENAFIDSGSNKDGFFRIKKLLNDNLDYLATINKSMSDTLHHHFDAIAEKPFVKQYLND